MEIQMSMLRAEPRLQESHAMLVHRCNDGVERLAKSGNLSFSGCAFSSDLPLGKGESIEILLSIDGRVVEVRGEIVRKRTLGEVAYEMGVRFTRVPMRAQRMLGSLMEIEGLTVKSREGRFRAVA
ncbi:MAG: hypothetical protein C0609_07935 [Deltaproteobacteria bacterium]|nr:MAG: hypothetical protein C0609_07935 [Deltaproteobacteria bacterium]